MRYGPAPDPATLARDLLVRNVVPGGCSNVIARTRLVTRLGGFDPRLTQLADRDLWIRLAQSGRAATCDEIVVAYLLHGGNMRQQGDLDGIAELEYLLEKHRDARRAPPRQGGAGRRLPLLRARAARRRPACSRSQDLRRSRPPRAAASPDAGRALGSLLLGRRPGALTAGLRPRLRHLAEEEIGVAPHALARGGRVAARSDREHDRRTLAERRQTAGEPCGSAGAGATLELSGPVERGVNDA